MEGKGLLIILSGPSGVGKGTVREAVMKETDLDLSYSISMTTRPPRPGERDGREYYFVDDKTFNKNIKEGNFLEWCEFVGHRYGTPKDKLEEMRNNGENVFLEIEVTGAAQVLEKVKKDPKVLSIFLMPPSEQALEDRIRSRKYESEEAIKARLDKGIKEMEAASSYDYVVLNDYVDRASREIIHIIKNALKENENSY
ncbi:MAG: guanylate kinase [Coprobacillus sp.]|nr:guanylate kinase [Coprobacillus sp.]